VLVSAALFVALVPFARQSLPRIEPFIPVYGSALVVLDLVTAVLLFGQFRFLGTPGLGVLASGYLFSGFLTISHGLSFPGLFAPDGLLGAGPQTTAWLYMFWHGGFPLMVAAYAWLKRRAPSAERARDGAIVAGILAALAPEIVWKILRSLLQHQGHRDGARAVHHLSHRPGSRRDDRRAIDTGAGD
jgi:Membrane-associated sensor, integral membrane domain